MTKKILVVIVLFFMAYEAQSQVLISLILGDKLNSDELEFGLEGGGNFSMISGMDSHKFYPDWNIGFYFDYQYKGPWHFYSGVLVKSKMGLNKLTDKDLAFLDTDYSTASDGDFAQVLRYFMVPFLTKYQFKNRFYVEAGTQVGWMFKSYIQYESKDKDYHIFVKDFNKDLIHWFDIGFLGGAGYKFKGKKRPGMTVGIKYYRGFTNVYKGYKTKNNSIFLKVNIPIGAGEQARKKRAEKAAKKAEKKKTKEQKQ